MVLSYQFFAFTVDRPPGRIEGGRAAPRGFFHGVVPSLTRWVAVLTPAVVVAVFEYVRHRYLISLVPTDLGNWLTAGLAFAAPS